MEVQVSKQEAKLLIQDFDPSKEYDFQIIAVRGSEQSKPLHAKHEGKSLAEGRSHLSAVFRHLHQTDVKLKISGERRGRAAPKR